MNYFLILYKISKVKLNLISCIRLSTLFILLNKLIYLTIKLDLNRFDEIKLNNILPNLHLLLKFCLFLFNKCILKILLIIIFHIFMTNYLVNEYLFFIVNTINQKYIYKL